MKGFFTNLVDRHLGTCETIQPRSLGRFEIDRNNLVGADNTMADVTERNQTLQTSDDFSIANSPTITDRKPDPIERENDISSLSSDFLLMVIVDYPSTLLIISLASLRVSAPSVQSVSFSGLKFQ